MATKMTPDEYYAKHLTNLAEKGVRDRWVPKPWAKVDPRIGGILPSRIYKKVANGGRQFMGYEKTLDPARQKRADAIAAHTRNEPKPAQVANTKAPTKQVSAPKEPSRKALSHVSARMKQKAANRGAGIRT